MIIRRKMTRLSSRRPIGIIGLRALRQSSDHVRRMVVSQLPASISNTSSAEVRSEQSPAYTSFDTPLAPPHSEAQSRMPRDLQAMYDMHKALGHIQAPKKSLRERIAERKASEPQPAPPPAARIQKRPDNVRYEPDSRIQRPPTPTFVESDIEPLPEMPPPKSNRVRSFVEYVNVSSGVPESRQSDETGADDSNDSEDDLPDAMPGSYMVDGVDSSSQDSVSVPHNAPIQRNIDDEHPTLVDMPLESLQSPSDSHSEPVQRRFDPLETSDEDLFPPPRYNAPHADDQQDEFSDADAYTETVIDSRSESPDNPPVQRSFDPLETSDEDLLPPSHYDAPHADSRQGGFSDAYTETVIDSRSESPDSPPVQRSFDPLETSDEDLLPPSHYDAPHADSRQGGFSDADAYTETAIDSVSESPDNPPVQRSFDPPETSDDDLLPPSHYDAPHIDSQRDDFSNTDDDVYTETAIDSPSTTPIQRSFEPLETSDEDLSPPLRDDVLRIDGRQDEYSNADHDVYTETSIEGGTRDISGSSSIQRSFAPLETSNEDLFPPSHPDSYRPESDGSDGAVESKQNDRIGGTLHSPPVQRNFDPIEASDENLLPPSSYNGDNKANTPASPIQRLIDDEWEDASPLMDIDQPSFEKPTVTQREFDSVETSTEDLLPPSYGQPDRATHESDSTEKPMALDRGQPRRMTVSRSDSPIVQRFPQPDSEQTNSAADTLQRDSVIDDHSDAVTSELPYQALDLGRALLDAGIAKPRQEVPSQQQRSFPILMPPIGRAHHSTSSAPTQRVSVDQSVQRTEAPVPSQVPPSSVDASLLDALGMAEDTVIQRSGAQMPSISESPPQPETSVTVQRLDEGTGESIDSGETLETGSDASPNVEEMAKQVYRILQRRFRVERERSKGR